jgi:hypothetical protein
MAGAVCSKTKVPINRERFAGIIRWLRIFEQTTPSRLPLLTKEGTYEFLCRCGRCCLMSGPNSLTTFENVSLPIINMNFSLRCDQEFRFGE